MMIVILRSGIAFAPYADLLWYESAKPILADATRFAKEVKAVRNESPQHELTLLVQAHPHQMLAYNLSPSFNWDCERTRCTEMF